MSQAAAPTPREKKRTPPQLWVSSTYFAEGFPYSFVNNVIEILFKELGASLQAIGLTSLFHLPWNLKFLWGPFVDQYETKRRWLIGVEIAISVVMVVVALLAGTMESITAALISAVFFLAFLSATHDIAIDGYYLEALNEKEQAAYVGWRAWFYRIAGIALGGPLLFLAGRVSWFAALLAVSVLMIGITAYHAAVLPQAEERKAPIIALLRALVRPRILIVSGLLAIAVVVERQLALIEAIGDVVGSWPIVGRLSFSEWVVLGLLVALVLGTVAARGRLRDSRKREQSSYTRSFTSFMEQPQAGLLLAFVILFRTGESFLTKMRWPFLSDVVKMPLEDYGLINGVLGVTASGGATLLGGWLIARVGLRRCIWPFVIGQNALNLLYMWLGFAADPSQVSSVIVASVIAVEHMGAGLGTAVFMVYLMRCCAPDHKAGHMAILTALMSVSFTIAGVASGFLAESLGFALYFGLTFVATIPSMLLIPFLPYLDGRSRPPEPES